MILFRIAHSVCTHWLLDTLHSFLMLYEIPVLTLFVHAHQRCSRVPHRQPQLLQVVLLLLPRVLRCGAHACVCVC